MRGPSRNPTWPAVTAAPSTSPATRFSARSPGLRVRASSSRPQRTRMRLTPVSGTTSATVPSATRSSASFRFGSGRSRLEPAHLAQSPPQRHHQAEGHAHRGEPLVRVAAARLVRVEDGGGRRELHRDGVVVDHHHRHAQLGRGPDLGHAGDAAVERDEQARSLRCQPPDRLRVEAVALHQPVRHVRHHVAARRPQERRQQRGRGHAVDVVVAVERDAVTALERALDDLHCVCHPSHQERIREIRQPRPQELLGRRRVAQPAAGEHARRDRLQLQLPGEPLRHRLVARHLHPPPREHEPSGSTRR